MVAGEEVIRGRWGEEQDEEWAPVNVEELFEDHKDTSSGGVEDGNCSNSA